MSTLTESSLAQLHETRCMNMETEEDLINYLLDSVPFLENEDRSGWVETFQPEPQEEIAEPPKKKRRCAPSTVTPDFHLLPPCVECKSTDVLDDVTQGTTVCLSCGLIQSQGVFTADTAHCNFSDLVQAQRVSIHRYSRVIHFADKMRYMCAESSPRLLKEDEENLLAFCGGEVTRENLRKGLTRLKLSKKYLRHFESLCLKLIPTYEPLHLDAAIRLEMMKKFRVVEFWWDKKKKYIDAHRKIFFSYPFLFYQFCKEFHLPHLCKENLLLKNKKALHRQQSNYQKIQEYIGQNIC